MYVYIHTCMHISVHIYIHMNWTDICIYISVQFSSVQSLSFVWLLATPWTTARQTSLSITNSQSLPKLMSIELVMSSNHLILFHSLLLLPSIFPSNRVFSNESAFGIRWPKFGVSASISVLPMNTQDWSPLWCTGRDSQESSTPQFKRINSSVFSSHPFMTTGKTTALTNGPLLAKQCLCFLECCLG